MKLRIQSEDGQWVVYKETDDPGVYERLDPAEDRLTSITVNTKPKRDESIITFFTRPIEPEDRDGV